MTKVSTKLLGVLTALAMSLCFVSVGVPATADDIIPLSDENGGPGDSSEDLLSTAVAFDMDTSDMDFGADSSPKERIITNKGTHSVRFSTSGDSAFTCGFTGLDTGIVPPDFESTFSCFPRNELLGGIYENTITVTATSEENSEFTYSRDITLKYVAAKINIDDSNLSGLEYGDSPVTLRLAGEGPGDGAVTWESSNPSVMTVSGDVATITGAGKTVITATKAAGGGYGPFTDSVEVVVEKATPDMFYYVTKRGETATHTVYVWQKWGIPAPTGTVTFTDINGDVTYEADTEGSLIAEITGWDYSVLGGNSRVFHAEYSGDDNYKPASTESGEFDPDGPSYWMVHWDLDGGSLPWSGETQSDMQVEDGLRVQIPTEEDIFYWVNPPVKGDEFLGVTINGVKYEPGAWYTVESDIAIGVLWKSKQKPSQTPTASPSSSPSGKPTAPVEPSPTGTPSVKPSGEPTTPTSPAPSEEPTRPSDKPTTPVPSGSSVGDKVKDESGKSVPVSDSSGKDVSKKPVADNVKVTVDDALMCKSDSDTGCVVVDKDGNVTVRNDKDGNAPAGVTVTASDTNGDGLVDSIKVTGVKYSGSEPGESDQCAAVDPDKQEKVYRLYNPGNSEHLFTTDAVEYEVLAAKHGWKQEGVAWVGPNSKGSSVGVYRLYNAGLGDHHYTKDPKEAQKLVAEFGWVYDNNGQPLFYSEENTACTRIPVYRQYNGGLKTGQHHYTADKTEWDTLALKHGWKKDGIGWYAISQK